MDPAIAVCAHVTQIRPVVPRTPHGCEECQPGEDWRWCYFDETFV